MDLRGGDVRSWLYKWIIARPTLSIFIMVVTTKVGSLAALCLSGLYREHRSCLAPMTPRQLHAATPPTSYTADEPTPAQRPHAPRSSLTIAAPTLPSSRARLKHPLAESNAPHPNRMNKPASWRSVVLSAGVTLWQLKKGLLLRTCTCSYSGTATDVASGAHACTATARDRDSCGPFWAGTCQRMCSSTKCGASATWRGVSWEGLADRRRDRM